MQRPATVAVVDEYDLVRALAAEGVSAGTPVAVAVGGGIGLSVAGAAWAVKGDSRCSRSVLARVTEALAPRWVWWSAAGMESTAGVSDLAVGSCWDLAAVHRLLHGSSRDDPGTVWAVAQGLSLDRLPRSGQLDLLDASDEPAGPERPDEPVRADGYLRPEWGDGGIGTAEQAARWAAAATEAYELQAEMVRAAPDGRRRPDGVALPLLTAWSESAADLLAVELAARGLPLDRTAAERLIESHVGTRPEDEAADQALRQARDDAVRRTVPGSEDVDLRNPAQVRGMLGRIGIDVPDTRSWRLEPLREAHPGVAALLRWRKAERIATTYGYRWLDRHVAGGRLRGAWSGSDGAAGRMTAQAGLHNLPAELRAAVLAEDGHVFVRADLGQVEPRVLAAVSGDDAFAEATREPDLYSPVAARLGCDRPTAKVAVLAAMYGQTSGAAGSALKAMDKAYPVAMRYLRAAEEEGRQGRDVRTYGGRLVRMYPIAPPVDSAAVAGRGRYARNAVVQGAAAELFKMWAVTVRAGLRSLDPRAVIVLCLHDELLLHVPEEHTEAAAALLADALQQTAGRWAAGSTVGFVADIATMRCWADAKDGMGLTAGTMVRSSP